MSNRDQRTCLPSQCILAHDTLPGPAPPKISEPPSRRFKSKAPATSRKRKNCDRVKPPANGFLLFRSQYVSVPANQISGDGSRKRQVDLTREAGVTWRHLSQAQRDIYRDTARQNMAEHKARHPDYWTSRRGKDGKYVRADSDREQGSSVKASHGVREAVLSGGDLCEHESAFAPTAAHSPSCDLPSPSCDAPSPCPSFTSSVSEDDCPTPRASSQQSLVLPAVDSSSEQPLPDGLELHWFSDFIDESQLLPILAPSAPRYSPEASFSTQLYAQADPCASFPASKELSEPMYGLSYEDWAFVEGEDFFRDGAQALDGITTPLADFMTF